MKFIVPPSKIKKIFFIVLLFLSATSSFSQLSDLHYLPPLKMALNSNIFTKQRVYISTPETVSFEVDIYRGTNAVPVATISVFNGLPATYDLPDDVNDITMVSNENTGIALQNSGLRLKSRNGELFYVSFRGNSNSQGESLTSKGRTALGTDFKWGSIPTVDFSNSSHNVVLGLMATEDGTIINVSDFDPGCTFRKGSDWRSGITEDNISIVLDANETFVLEARMLENPINLFGTIGASIISNKPIAVSTGNLMVGRIQNVNQQDAGMDQIVPINKLGKEYVFIRGLGDNEKELPVIVATENNTNIYINGSSSPIRVLNEGEFFLIDGSYYSGNDPGDNMYVRTSRNAYAYQLTAGRDAFPNLGMNFISPVNCLMPREVNEIALIDELPSRTVTGGITLLASTSTPDSNITIIDSTGPVALPESKNIAGTNEWKTFYLPGLRGNVSISSSGPISVGYIGFNGVIGTASYFSGFDTVPEVDFTFGAPDIDSDDCLGSTIVLDDEYDSYQWYLNGEAVPGATQRSFTPSEVGEVYLEVSSGGDCLYESNTISIYYCEPEILLNKTVDKVEVEVGDTVVFTIVVQNPSIVEITNLIIEDELPSGLTLVDAVPTKGSWIAPSWDVGNLMPGELQSISLIARVDSVPINSNSNILVNTAFNFQDQVDNNIEIDNPSASVVVGNDSDNDGVENDIDLDDDNDGILDSEENDEDDDADGIINSIDLDSDNDGITDIVEALGLDEDGDGRVDYPIDGDPKSMIDDNDNGVDDNVETNPLPDIDTDGDGYKDRLDIDSDNDGIPDNIEAQSTSQYVPPDNKDDNHNGLDNAYDRDRGRVIFPEDTDEDNIPDYLDGDSDNDALLDEREGHDPSPQTDSLFTGVDTDGDGLDDGYEGDDTNDGFDVNDEINNPSIDLPDIQNPGGDVDYRDDTIRDNGEPNIGCNHETGLDAEGNPCVFIDNESVGPLIDQGFFRINNIDSFPINNFKVYNRWGRLVYETNAYDSATNNFRGISTAKGTINSEEELPSGVYYYILNYKTEGGNKTLSGYLYLLK